MIFTISATNQDAVYTKQITTVAAGFSITLQLTNLKKKIKRKNKVLKVDQMIYLNVRHAG